METIWDTPDADDTIVYDNDQQIKCVTLVKLIEKLTGSQVDHTCTTTFFFCFYGTFSFDDCLSLFYDRLKYAQTKDDKEKKIITLRIANLVRLAFSRFFY